VIRILEAIVGTIGLAAVGFAVVLAVAPGEIGTVVPIQSLVESTPISELRVRVIGLGLVGTVCTVWVAWTAGTDRAKELPADSFSTADVGFGTLREAPPEHATAAAVVGEPFDDAIERAIAEATNGDDADRVRRDVRSFLVAVVAHTRGCSEPKARELVDAGEWTDDAVAAEDVADEEASLPLRRRVRAWLRPSRTKRDRIERSIRAIHRLERGAD
jgi:hypothetical protein